MDPKGKGILINDNEKESIFNEPRDDKPTDLGSSHKKRDEKKKTVNSNFSFDYSRIPQSSNVHLLSIPLGKPPILMERTTDFGVTKCVATCSLSIQVYGR